MYVDLTYPGKWIDSMNEVLKLSNDINVQIATMVLCPVVCLMFCVVNVHLSELGCGDTGIWQQVSKSMVYVAVYSKGIDAWG